MKKFVEFLNHPLLHLVIGLLLYLCIGGGIWYLGEAFDPVSAFLGGLTVSGMDILSYGARFLYCKKSS